MIFYEKQAFGLLFLCAWWADFEGGWGVMFWFWG